MARYSKTLEKKMKNYINGQEPVSLEYQERLKSTSADIRYKLLMEVKGMKCTATGISNAACIRDLAGMKCMLDGMSEEQKFNILKKEDAAGQTALHVAVEEQTGHPHNSVLAEELISNLSTKQLYQLLKLQSETNQCTVLHLAVYHNRADFVRRIFVQLTRDQKYELLSLRDVNGVTPADLSVPATFSPVQGLDETKQEVDGVNRKLQEHVTVQNQLSERCKELEKNKVQAHGLKETLRNVDTINRELVAQGKVQNRLLNTCNELDRQKVQQTQELRETQKKVETLDGKVTELERRQMKQVHVAVDAGQMRELTELNDKFMELEEEKTKQTTELREAQDKVKTLQNGFAEQQEIQLQLIARCSELESQKIQQDEVIAVQREELAEQRGELSEQREEIQQMKGMLDYLQKSLGAAIVTDATGDQEVEDY